MIFLRKCRDTKGVEDFAPFPVTFDIRRCVFLVEVVHRMHLICSKVFNCVLSLALYTLVKLVCDTAHQTRETKLWNHRRTFVLLFRHFVEICFDLIFVMFGNLEEHNQLWQGYMQVQKLL